MSRPCGYYPPGLHPGVLLEDLELPWRPSDRIQAPEDVGQYIWAIVSPGISWYDTGLADVLPLPGGGRAHLSVDEKSTVISLLAGEGYVPYLPIVPPLGDVTPAAQAVFEQALEILPRIEQRYQEHVTRYLVRRYLMDTAILFTTDGITDAVDADDTLASMPYGRAYRIAQRRNVEAAMPIICSFWPYFVAIEQAERTRSPYVNWAAVNAGPIRFQGCRGCG